MFKHKGIVIHTQEFDETWLDFVQNAGLNTLGLHPVGGKNAHLSLEEAVVMHNLPRFRSLRQKAAARGICVEYEAHAMRWLLPRSVFKYHPEWFRMNENGDRTDDYNLCVSNQDALDYISERTELLAQLTETGSDRYFFWTDDVTNGACRCPACRGLSASDQQLRAVNAMLSGLKRYKKQAKLCYIAYHEAIACPTKVEPLDGVFLEYAPINRDSHVPMDDESCEQNRSEAKSIRDLLAFFGKKDSQVLEYWMDNSRFSNWTKPPKPMKLDDAVMRRDVEFYAGMGFESVTSFGCYLGQDYRELYGDPEVQLYGDILNGKQN